jgi:hypothetical protein
MLLCSSKSKNGRSQGLPPMTDEEKREYKLAYMRDYIRRRKAQKQTL